MGKSIYAYSDITKITQHPRFNEFRNLPQITATGGLKLAMKELCPENCNKTIGVQIIQKIVTGDWENSIFQQHVQLSRIMRELPVPEADRDIILGFKKNKNEVLLASRHLAEAGSKPEDLCVTNKEEFYFQKIWALLEKEEPSFIDFHARMQEWTEHPDKMIESLQKTIDISDGKAVVLHGFYFITPLQERIFNLFEKSGKDLLFLCCISRRYPEVGMIWHANFKEENGYPPESEWVYDDFPSTGSEAFCGLFEPNFTRAEPDHIKIRCYSDEQEFVADIDRIATQEERALFSGNIQRTEQILREYYPDKFKRRHLLAYPVGQYIYCLHSMWDPISEQLDLTLESIQKCFASGWVCTGGLQGKDYLRELEMIAPYFRNCSTVDDWRKRLSALEDSIHNIVSLFEEHIERNNLKEKKWHRLMGNPFLNLSIFACRTERVRNTVSLIEHLLKTAEILFTSREEVNLEEHFNRLGKLLSSAQNAEVLLDEEKVIINELGRRLSTVNSPVKKCFPGDLAEAVMLLVGGGFFDEDSFSVLADRDEDFIKPLYQAEETPAIGPHKVHLCMCDEECVPGKAKGNPWPITDTMIDNLTASADECGRKCLWDMKFVAANNPLCIRYLFASLLQNEDVELSWIVGGDPKEIAPSPYIKLMDSVYNLKHSKGAVYPVTEKEAKEASPLERGLRMSFPASSPVPSEAKYDLALCPLKYLYGYLLQELPSYCSEFHYSFAVSSLISAFAAVSGESKKTVGSHLFAMLPYLRDIEFRQMTDFVANLTGEETEEFEGIAYSIERLRVHFLTEKILNRAKVAWEEIVQDGQDFNISFVRPPLCMKVCMFCQHNSYCMSALYAADEEDADGN